MDPSVISTYLRLAAPLQSWATARVTGNVVRTQNEPTEDALRGLVAASLGAKRGQWPRWLGELQFAIRTDRHGELVDEFQTINPRDEDLEFQRRLYALIHGKGWTKSAHFTPDGQNLTAIVRRTYLADAEFLVEVQAGEHAGEVTRALRHPRFTPYLGRKAFAPTFPYYLGIGEPGLLQELPTGSRSRGAPTGAGEPERVDLKIAEKRTRSQVEVAVLPYEQWLCSIRKRLRLPDTPRVTTPPRDMRHRDGE